MLDKDLLDGMIYRPIEELLTPKQGRKCHVNRWWVCHPEKGAAFYKTTNSPQCNDFEQYVKDWAKKFPNHEAKLLPVAYI